MHAGRRVQRHRSSPTKPGLYEVKATRRRATRQELGTSTDARARVGGRQRVLRRRHALVAAEAHRRRHRRPLLHAGRRVALPEAISYSGRGVTVVEERDLWDMPIILMLLLGLIAAEWGYPTQAGPGVMLLRDRACVCVLGVAAVGGLLARLPRAASAQDTTCSSSPASAATRSIRRSSTSGRRRSSTRRRSAALADANDRLSRRAARAGPARINAAVDARERHEGVRRLATRAKAERRGLRAADRPRQLRRQDGARSTCPAPISTAGRLRRAPRPLHDAAHRLRQHRELERRVRPGARRARRGRSSPPRRTGGERNETRFPEFFVEALDGEDRGPRSQRPRVGARGVRLRAAKVKATYEQDGHILTEHATLDDGNEGKLAATQFLAAARDRGRRAANADPALRALLEQRDALERQVAELRLQKDAMDAARVRAGAREAADGSGAQDQGDSGARGEKMKRALVALRLSRAP